MKTHGFALPILAAGCMAYAAVSIAKTHPNRTLTEPPAPPPRSTFEVTVAATGLIEPSSENIHLGSHRAGVVEKVLVTTGDEVKEGQALFTLDTRELRAQIEVARATVEEASAQERVAAVELDRTRRNLEFAKRLPDERAISVEERTQRELAVAAAEARTTSAQVAVKAAQARVQVIETDLERSTVRAPLDSTVLQVKVRPGEYVGGAPGQDAWMVLGRLDPLHLRADVDEHEAWRIPPGATATACVRGNPEQKVSLQFVRFEPLVIPKKSLTGDATERVDTRVLQIIYRLQNPAPASLFVGQQMDVFISAAQPTTASAR